MKKIYSFIALMLMCFVGTANAQQGWDYVGDNFADDEIIAGPENFYVLQEGDNTKVDGKTDGHSANAYMVVVDGKVKMATEPNGSGVVSFIQDGENAAGFPVYVMKHFATGLYLTTNGFDSKTMAQAYHFGIRKAVAVPEDGTENGKDATWEEYSNIVSDSRSVNAVDNNAWVLCKADGKEYIGFIGDISFQGWIDTNNWYLHVATKAEMSGYEKYVEVFDKYFADGFGPEIFPVGKNPGCISEEFYNKFEAVYNELDAVYGNSNLSDQEYADATAKLEAIIAEYEKELVVLNNIYFVAKNIDGRGFLTVTDDNKKGRGNKALVNGLENVTYDDWTPEAMTTWNLQNAKYIWLAEPSKNEGKILLKNFATGQYLTSKNDFAMVDKDANDFVCKRFAGVEFYFTFDGGMIHFANHSNNKLINYNHADDRGSRVLLYTISQDVIDSLSTKVEQKALNEKLSALVKDAANDMASLKFKNGFVEEGFYNFPNDSGLVKNFMEVNSFASTEGKKEAPFDGKLDTYFHTAWSATDVESQGTVGSHWVKFDLGKEVSSLVIKFTKRQGAANSHINKYSLYTVAEGQDPATEKEMWSKKLYTSDDSIMYSYADSTTHIDTIQLGQKAQYILFDVESTRGKHASEFDKMTAGTGPFWHCSEFRLYDAAECVPNPLYEIMSEEAKTALANAIEKAEAELKAGKAQESTCKEIEEAVKNFWDAYPNPSGLEEDLKVALEIAEKAKANEGEGLAQFEAGAGAELEAVVVRIQGEIEGKTLSLEQIEAYAKQLEDAVAVLNSKLHTPVAGAYYRIEGVEPNVYEGDAHAQWGAYAMAPNADVNGNPRWAYDASIAENKINTIWFVDKDEKGYTFKNLSTGLYLNNRHEGLTEEEEEKLEGDYMGFSKEPKHFNLEIATGADNAFLIALKKDLYMNFQPTGNLVSWWDRNDMHSFFTFKALDEIGSSASYQADVEAGKTQILSYPFAINAVYTQNEIGSAMQVLGMKDGMIHLAPIEGQIEAGVPFIVQTLPADASVEGDKGENYVEVELLTGDPEEFAALPLVTERKVANGLVSCPISVKPGVGFGYIVNSAVIPTEENTKIAAGTGFFNNEIPEYTGEDGVCILKVEGEITGEGLAVENVELVKNVANDVYTVSGVKVRSNVKTSAATKGLPKGVYIVGGKKVIVK